MQKPNNYDNTQASGEFTPIELGGHLLVIKQVEEMKSRAGKPMLKIFFDTADSDKQPRYFSEQFKNDIRPDKKWPNNGIAYVLTEDENGNCSRSFKTFTTSVEKSNNGFQIAWGDRFCQCLKNRLIGGVFGIVEDYYNNKVIKKHQLRWFRSMDKVMDAEVPEPKLYTGYSNNNGNPVTSSDGFMNIPSGIDEELPFN